jgi:hypothetical protein
MNSVHPCHSAGLFSDFRHIIFAFYDSTFECVAWRYKTEVQRGSIASLAAARAAAWS